MLTYHRPGLHGTGTCVPIGHDCVIPKSLGHIFAARQSALGSFTNPFSEYYYYKGYLLEVELPINQDY